MKDIPIVILNRDRLTPLIKLVNGLKQRGYYNIIVIDNESSYVPLLNYYITENLNVFYNNGIVKNDNSTLHWLFEANHPQFIPIKSNWYVYTDSDVYLDKNTPENFIQELLDICKKYTKFKVGLGLHIDDLPQNSEYTKEIIEVESQYWNNKIPNEKNEMYTAPIDTTFAIYPPNQNPIWSDNCIRVCGNFTAHHQPWYYDINNMPEDETYYTKNMKRSSGAVWSLKVKDKLKL